MRCALFVASWLLASLALAEDAPPFKNFEEVFAAGAELEECLVREGRDVNERAALQKCMGLSSQDAQDVIDLADRVMTLMSDEEQKLLDDLKALQGETSR